MYLLNRQQNFVFDALSLLDAVAGDDFTYPLFDQPTELDSFVTEVWHEY